MRKYSSTLIIALFLGVMQGVLAQEPDTESLNLNYNIPDVIPPSPTVNSLMRFEEIPVDTYTGQPSIVLPLVSKEIAGFQLPVSLKYHSAGLKVDERSGWVGTGWALDGEIVISRTVMDFPDEIKLPPGQMIYGILHNNYEAFDVNNPNFNGYQDNLFQRHIWYTSVRRPFYNDVSPHLEGQFDKEYDLYQLSLLGKTARFIITKRVNQNILDVKFLENDHHFRIEPVYDPNSFQISEFIIKDTQGYTYVLNEKEVFTQYTLSVSQKQSGETVMPASDPGKYSVYTSAWKVASIRQGTSVLAQFVYENVNETYPLPKNTVENTIHPEDFSLMDNHIFIFTNNNGMQAVEGYNRGVFTPKFTYTYSHMYAATKKIKDINFLDGSSIGFTMSGPHPENFFNNPSVPNSGTILNSVVQKQNNQTVKKIDLSYYTDPNTNRLYLTALSETGIDPLASPLVYEMDYNGYLPVAFGSPHKDLWGYYQAPYNEGLTSVFRGNGMFSNPEDVKLGTLAAITYPNGGTKSFVFECNSFYHQGSRAFNDWEYKHYNKANWLPQTLYLNNQGNYSHPQQTNISITDATKAHIVLNTFNPGTLNNPNNSGFFWDESGLNYPLKRFTIKKIVNGQELDYENFVFNSQAPREVIFDLEVGNYILKFDPGTTDADQQVILYFKKFVQNPAPEIYGGGLRIKEVNFVDENETVLSKKYQYQKGDNYSSGVIDGFLTNVRKYEKEYSQILAHAQDIEGLYFHLASFNFLVTEHLNGAFVSKTKGGYVGYEEVKIFQDGNGYEKKYYTTPKDYPTYPVDYAYPFVPQNSKDFMHGLPIKNEIYDQAHNKLVSNEYLYKTPIENLITKYLFTESYECAWMSLYNNYDNYLSKSVENVLPPTEKVNMIHEFYDNCGQAIPFYYYLIDHRFNKILIDKKITTEYFGQATMVTTEEFEFDPEYYLLTEKRTIINDGSTTKTMKNKYYYAVGTQPSNYTNSGFLSQMVANNIITSPIATESYENSVLLNTVHAHYDVFTNQQIKPKKIFATKGTAHGFTEKVVYDAYNLFGLPNQVSQSLGTPVVYIYGYHNTKPVAKIEGMTFAAVANSHKTAIQTASDSGNEANLLTALNNLRNAYPNAQITTFTYKPSVGVSTVTDPKGYRMNFFYDSFNRLEQVTDMQGNILSENTYHYRTQQSLGQDQNYIQSITYKKPTTQGSVNVNNPSDALIQVNYFDGLGRPIQQVAHKQSGTGLDIITHMEYDHLGRQTKEFLPFVRQTPSLDFMEDATTAQASFYASNNTNLTANPHFATTTNPYSEQLLELSPLQRLQKQAAPGEAWAMGSGHEVKFEDAFNTTSDKVRIYKANTSWELSTLAYHASLVQNQGFYPQNQLYKTITKDENWVSGVNNITVEFKNQLGQVVLKRTYNITNPLDDTPYDTYYVYDIYGNLTYVIPPKVGTAKGSISETVLNELCYQYRYDDRNRLVHKRLPGRDWEYIIYDNLDRPVATGPAMSPFKNTTSEGWLITKYDALNRPVITAWMAGTVNGETRKNFQAARNTATTNLSVLKTTTNITIKGVSVKYNNLTWPTSGYDILTVQYYDTYDFDFAVNIPTTVMAQAILQGTPASSTKSLPTGGKTRVLEQINNYMFEQYYTAYDIKGQPVFSYETNYKGGHTQTETALDFIGTPQEMVTTHKYTSNSTPLVTTEKFEYTPQGRLETHTHTINNEAEQILAVHQYDGLGQLIQKQVGSDASSNPLQNVDYRYNIRGWLTHINDLNNILGNGDLFAFKINYHELEMSPLVVTPLYNGNIAEIHWRSAYDNIKRGYTYKYDKLNRLKEAHYVRNGFFNNSYNEFVDYDKNGNIMSLFRTGMVESEGSPMVIDQMTYTYANNGQSNKLMKVTDAPGANRDYGFKDDSDGTNDIENDYSYDNYGNMTSDQNKGIQSIVYNHLNLPTIITFDQGTKIEYLYNAAGVKLAKTVIDQATTTTVYMGGYQYVDNTLQFFPQAEGYVKFTEGNNNQEFFNYIYQYKDHLGNNRMSYTIDPSDNVLKILTEDHYYPFGMKHQGYSNYVSDVRPPRGLATLMVMDVNDLAYKYKYNGKELQDELGLNVTAMDFRQYDNAIGRFYNIDVMSDIMPSISPYRFGFNNPVIWKDPSGLFESGGGDDCDCPTIHLNPVVITGYKNMPRYFPTYFLIDRENSVRYQGTLDEYNKQFGTNYHGDRYLDQWYFVNYYKPFKEEMINSMHAAQKKAGMFVMGVGGAVYAAPLLLASPAVTSAISATISNPMTQRALILGGTNHFSQQLINGKVDQADVAISMIPGAAGIQALKPIAFASFDFYSTSDYSFIGGTGNKNKSNASFYRDAATGYILHGLSFGVSPSNGLRNFGEIPLNTVLNTGQNSMSNLLEKNGWE